MNIVPFLMSPLAVKRDIAVTIWLTKVYVRAYVHACMLAFVHPDMSGS